MFYSPAVWECSETFVLSHVKVEEMFCCRLFAILRSHLRW